MSLNQDHDDRRYLAYFGVSIIIAYLIPLHVLPYSSFYNEWVAALGLFVLVAGFLHRANVEIRLPSIALLPVGLALIIAVQVCFGMLTFPSDGVLAIGYFTLAAIGILLGATIASEVHGPERVCAAIAYAHLIAGLISALIASLQFANIEYLFVPFAMLMDHTKPIRPHGNIAQANQLALLFCLGIASAWWLFQKGRLGSRLAILAVFLLIWGLALTQSRIGWVILPSFAILAFIWRRKFNFLPVSPIVIGGLLLFYLLLVIGLPEISSIFGSQVTSPVERITGNAVRLILFQQAWAVSITHPWFGAGWYEFGPQQVAVAADFPITVYARHCHNLLLNFAAELGWPVTIVAIGSVVLWMRAILRKNVTPLIALLLFFVVAIGAHSMVEFPLWYGYVLFPVSVLIGMAHQEQLGSVRYLLSRRYVATLLITGISLLIFFAMDYRRAAAGFTAMEFNAMGVVIDKNALEKPSFTVLPQMYGYFEFLDVPIRPGIPQSEIMKMERITKRFGGTLMLTRMSQVYALNDRPEDAIRAMTTIQRLHPADYAGVYGMWSNAPSGLQGVFLQMPAP